MFPPIINRTYDGLIPALLSLNLSDCQFPRPRCAIIAVAAPIGKVDIRMTNLEWDIVPKDILLALGLETIIIMNDFEAIALALPTLENKHLKKIGVGGRSVKYAPMVVLGPGTGLGVACVLHAVGRWIVLPSEGGHIKLSPQTEEELDLWPYLSKSITNIKAEDLLCGNGLVRLASSLAIFANSTESYTSPEDVTKGSRYKQAIPTQAVHMFIRLLGRLAGDMALTFLARGGVYISGGVATKIEDFLTIETFRTSFEDKESHKELLSKSLRT